MGDLRTPALPDLERVAPRLDDIGATLDAATPREKKQIAHTLLETGYLDGGKERPVADIEPQSEYQVFFDLMM